MLTVFAALALLQQGTAPDSSFARPGDLRLAAAAVAATAGIAYFDERIARFSRRPAVQGDSARADLVRAATVVNEVPLTIAAVATWGVGRLAGWRTVADVGLHVTESLLATEITAELLRAAIGRVRPTSSNDDAFVFSPGKGLTSFEHRAFPSLHAAVAFATAGSLAEELRMRKPGAARYIAPALYGAAMIPGLTRLYLDKHWASDVLAGSVLGAYLGTRVTRYAHGRRTRLDEILLGARVLPRQDGLVLGWGF